MKTRYLLFYFTWWIFLGLLLTFIFPEIGFFWFVQTYWRYLILVSISYFTYNYFYGYEEKKYLYLRRFLLLGNVYLSLHLFFRPLLHIEPALFLLLGVIILLMWYISQLYMKYKWPFYTIWSILCFLILISGFFYLYPERPDTGGFIAQQENQLIIISPFTQPQRKAYIKLTNLDNQKEQDLFFQTGTQYFPLIGKYQLSYISATPQNEAEVFIIFTDGDVFQLFPQSSVKFTEELFPEIWTFGWKYALRTGNIDDESWMGENTSLYPPLTLSSEVYLQITTFYWQNLRYYLTQQMGSPFIASATMQMVNRKILTFLSDIFPGFFSQNRENAQLFEYYFNLSTTDSILLTPEKYTLSPDTSSGKSLRSQIKQNSQLAFPLIKSF